MYVISSLNIYKVLCHAYKNSKKLCMLVREEQINNIIETIAFLQTASAHISVFLVQNGKYIS